MANKFINTNKALKITALVYAIFFVVGIVFTVINGLNLDINFSGGTRISYSYTGEIDEKDINKEVAKVIDKDFTAGKNTSIAGDIQTFTVVLTGRDSISAKTQEQLTDSLAKAFTDNKIALYDSNSVSPSVAGDFLVKSLAAVLLTAVLVIIYVGIRFRKIGGVSAAVTALCALVLDILVSFFTCAIFGLKLDSNYIAVILTLLGYSLNDTIVIYDRVRENRKLYPDITIRENVNRSVTETLTRNIVTTVTTVCAVLTIIVVSELYGLTTLRTFAIPMVFGLISGCISSMFISGPIWVLWRNHINKKKVK